MKRESILIILGALVALSPWSGLPQSWMEFVLVVLGLAVIVIAVTLRRRTSEPAAISAQVRMSAESSEPAEAHATRPFIS